MIMTKINITSEIHTEDVLAQQFRVSKHPHLQEPLFEKEVCSINSHFQPIVKKSSNGKLIVGFEALARETKEDGSIEASPINLLHMVKEKNMQYHLYLIMLEKSCKFMANAQEKGLPENFFVSVNADIEALVNYELVHDTKRIITQYNIDPYRLKVEVLEDPFPEIEANLYLAPSKSSRSLTYQFREDWEDRARLTLNLSNLRELGVNVMLDDFGTAACNLSRIQELCQAQNEDGYPPFNGVKIDRKFMPSCSKESVEQAISTLRENNIIEFMLKYDPTMSFVVEGVETSDDEEVVSKIFGKNAIIQGFKFSKPVPDKEAFELLKSTNGPSQLALLNLA